MKAQGRIHMSKQLMESDYWESVKSQLEKVFTETSRKELGNGDIEVVGYSEWFSYQLGGGVPLYEAWFTNVGGVMKFDKFTRGPIPIEP